MPRQLFSNLLLALCLMGCKCDKPSGPFLMSDEAIEYFPASFARGSYWVFQDRKTGEIDTLRVTSQDWWGRTHGADDSHSCCKSNPCYTAEYITTRALGRRFSCDLYTGGSTDKKDGFTCRSNFNYYAEGKLKEKKLEHGQYIPYVEIKGTRFTDVLLMENPDGNYKDTILIARNIGPIRIYRSDSIDYELIDLKTYRGARPKW